MIHRIVTYFIVLLSAAIAFLSATKHNQDDEAMGSLNAMAEMLSYDVQLQMYADRIFSNMHDSSDILSHIYAVGKTNPMAAEWLRLYFYRRGWTIEDMLIKNLRSEEGYRAQFLAIRARGMSENDAARYIKDKNEKGLIDPTTRIWLRKLGWK